MTHYTVMVLSDGSHTLDELLAPFDENVEVPRYRDYADGKPSEHWYYRWLTETEKGPHLKLSPDVSWADLIAAYNEASPGDEDDDGSRLRVDPDEPTKAFSWSTYNPKSKWDWWTIGGRYSSRLLTQSGERVDQLRRKEWDIDATRGERELEYRAKAKPAREIYAKHGHVTWDQCREGAKAALKDDGEAAMKAAREMFWEQTSVKTYKATLPKDERVWFDFDGGDFLDQVMVPEEEYERQVKIEVARAITCYATLDLEGRWNEPGKMGWWGMSSDTESTRIGYYEAMNAMLEALPDDTLITVTDCHI